MSGKFGGWGSERSIIQYGINPPLVFYLFWGFLKLFPNSVIFLVAEPLANSKMKWSFQLMCVIGLTLVTAKFTPSYTPSVSESTNKFAFSLHKALPNKGNLVFSPWSVAFSLGMVLLGAGGGTLQEMMKVMSLDKLDPESVHYGFKQLREHVLRYNQDYEMNMFSTILIEESFRVSPVYKLKLQRYYDAHIHDASFAGLGDLVLDWINSWTSLKTGGRIRNIMSNPPDPDTVMLILNANYFKGVWEETFDRNKTRPSPFSNEDGQSTYVDTMYATRNMSIYTGYDLAVDAVDVPMKGDISFMFIMPESPRDFDLLQRNLSTEFLRTLLGDMSENPVELGVPKFMASSKYDLAAPLEAMGMKSLFSFRDADLSGISRNGEIAIQEVIHKAALDVDEEGATATSVTIISIVSRIKALKLHFNRPFLFLIRDTKSGLILFMGRVSNL